jgi:hypothetical protein
MAAASMAAPSAWLLILRMLTGLLLPWLLFLPWLLLPRLLTRWQPLSWLLLLWLPLLWHLLLHGSCTFSSSNDVTDTSLF